MHVFGSFQPSLNFYQNHSLFLGVDFEEKSSKSIEILLSKKSVVTNLCCFCLVTFEILGYSLWLL